MAATRTTTQLDSQAPCAGSCGGKCGGELVAVARGRDRRTGRATLTYQPCSVLLAQGWTGHADVQWVVEEPVVVTVWHQDGLVRFHV